MCVKVLTQAWRRGNSTNKDLQHAHFHNLYKTKCVRTADTSTDSISLMGSSLQSRPTSMVFCMSDVTILEH